MKRIYAMLLALMLLSCAHAQQVPLRDWEPHDAYNSYNVEAKGDYIYALETGGSSFGYDPPYRTTVYDLDENPLFTVDGYFAQYYDDINGWDDHGLNNGFGIVWLEQNHKDGIEWGVVSDTGEILMDKLTDIKGVYDGYIYYSRDFGIPLLEKILDKLDIHMGFAGRFNLQGDRLELPGSSLSGVDDQDYMILQLWGWDSSPQASDRFVYVNEAGEIAIDYAYERAYPFVDGSAVVKKDGTYLLIGPEGETVCELSQQWAREEAYIRAYQSPVLPVDAAQGMVLVNRRGEVINDTPFQAVWGSLLGNMQIDMLICEDEKGLSHFVDAQGRDLFSLPVENTNWCSNDPDALWVQVNGLWGRLDVQGIHGAPGSYTSTDRYQKIEILDGIGQLTDGSWVIIGEMGQALEPTEAPQYSDWK